MLFEMSTLTRTGKPAPPDEAGSGEGGGGRWVWLLTAGSHVEAELVKGRLETVGVPVVLDRRDPTPGAWLYLYGGNPRAPVQVFVPASLLDAARLELLEAGLTAPSAPQNTPAERAVPRRSWVWYLVAAVTALAIIWILLSALFMSSATCTLRLFCP
jgi:hypothetical protein